jgi:hypothetical protein
MPEAAVHEDCKPLTREDDIRLCPSAVAQPNGEALAKTEPTPMEDRPQRDLRFRVAPSIAEHDSGCCSRRSERPLRVAGLHIFFLARGLIHQGVDASTEGGRRHQLEHHHLAFLDFLC